MGGATIFSGPRREFVQVVQTSNHYFTTPGTFLGPKRRYLPNLRNQVKGVEDVEGKGFRLIFGEGFRLAGLGGPEDGPDGLGEDYFPPC